MPKEKEIDLRTIKRTPYPYDKWLKKPFLILYRTKDFKGDAFRMAQRIRTEANTRGMMVNFKVRDNRIALIVWDHIDTKPVSKVIK